MSVRVEFYGIPRQRMGRGNWDSHARTLGELLSELGELSPGFAASCLNGNTLQNHYLANINGERFTREPAEILQPGDTVLILSADVGG